MVDRKDEIKRKNLMIAGRCFRVHLQFVQGMSRRVSCEVSPV